MWIGMPSITPIQYWTAFNVPPVYGQPPVAWTMMTRKVEWTEDPRLPDFTMPNRLPEWTMPPRNEYP